MKKLLGLLTLVSVTALAIPTSRVCDVTTTQDTTLTGATAATLLLARNESRSCLLVVNKGANSVSISVSSAVNGTSGFPIPAGGNWEPTVVPVDAIYVLGGATTTVYSQEGREQ